MGRYALEINVRYEWRLYDPADGGEIDHECGYDTEQAAHEDGERRRRQYDEKDDAQDSDQDAAHS